MITYFNRLNCTFELSGTPKDVFFYLAGYRKYFDEPIVRARISRLRFPKTCPVCCAPSTSISTVSATPQNKQWLRPHWNPAFYARERRRIGLPNPITKSFLVHVCEEHHITDDGDARMRCLAMLFAALLSGLSIFALIFVGSDLSSGRGIHPLAIAYLVGLSLSLTFGYVAFRPNALEASVRIIGFDFDFERVWLELKNAEYRRQFIMENQAISEIVNWVEMA